jgi:nitrous oxide reductase accessory protein NosL
MLWQTNRIKHRQPPRRQLQLHPRAAKAAAPAEAKVARAVGTEDMAVVAADVAKVVRAAVVVDAVKAAPVVQAEVQAVLAAASVNSFAKRKSASSVSRKWI